MDYKFYGDHLLFIGYMFTHFMLTSTEFILQLYIPNQRVYAVKIHTQ